MILHACHKDAAYPFIGEKLGATELGIERRAEAVGRMLPQPILEPAAAKLEKRRQKGHDAAAISDGLRHRSWVIQQDAKIGHQVV